MLMIFSYGNETVQTDGVEENENAGKYYFLAKELIINCILGESLCPPG